MSCQEIVERHSRLLGSRVRKTSGSCYSCYLSCTSWIRPHTAKGHLVFITKGLLPSFQLRYTILAWHSLAEVHECKYVTCTDTLSKHLLLLSRFTFAAGLSSYPSMVSRSQWDLFYAHPVSMISLEGINLHSCALCLASNATEENPSQHVRVEAGGGREPEELA